MCTRWNSWATFGCGVNETILTDAADQMHALGLASAGYVYVNTDDCWMDAARDATTHEQVPTKVKFPGGFKNMIDCTPSPSIAWPSIASPLSLT